MIIYAGHKNLRCKNINADGVLKWILILEEYGPDIEYTTGDKNISADALSRLTMNGNQETTQETTYNKDIVS